VAIIWIVASNSDGGGGEFYDANDTDTASTQAWCAAVVGVLITLAYGGTFVLFRAGVVHVPGTILTLIGDTLLLSAIFVALRVYFIGASRAM
jgi:hypothetical protein